MRLQSGAAAVPGLNGGAAEMPGEIAAERPGKPDDDRWTIRGVPKDRQAMANKGAGDAKETVGPWVSDAILQKWLRQRALSKLPAVIPPEPGEPVTALQPRANAARAEADVLMEDLAVLEAIRPFTEDGMSKGVRCEAARVAVDRLKRLRVPRQSRQTKSQKSLPKPAESSDREGVAANGQAYPTDD